MLIRCPSVEHLIVSIRHSRVIQYLRHVVALFDVHGCDLSFTTLEYYMQSGIVLSIAGIDNNIDREVLGIEFNSLTVGVY